MLVFIYHLKTSFEQGYLIEEVFSRYRCFWVTISSATVDIMPTSTNAISLVLNTKHLLIIYKLHSVIISWCNCNNSKKYICIHWVNFEVKTYDMFEFIFFLTHETCQTRFFTGHFVYF